MYSHSYLISNYVKTSNLHVQINVTISYRKVSISVNLVNIVSISYRSENPGIAHHYPCVVSSVSRYDLMSRDHEILACATVGVYYPARDQYRLPVMVMEKMQHSLRDLVENYSNIPLNVKLSILDEVCLGLRYLHSRNPPIVHRDLTPNNILLGRPS